MALKALPSAYEGVQEAFAGVVARICLPVVYVPQSPTLRKKEQTPSLQNHPHDRIQGIQGSD